jgi:hypothetical protein
MRDISGLEIQQGDNVAFNPPYYKGLLIGVAVGFTPQKVRVEYKWQNRIQSTLIEPKNACKIKNLI